MSKSTSRINQSHGLSAEQLQELRLQQVSEETLPTVAGKGEEKGFRVLSHEAHLVHARIKTPQYDRTTGEDQSTEVVQKFGVNEFNKMKAEQAFAGNKVVILHDGSGPGSEDVSGAEPTDSLTPQIVSQPGAGLDLTEDYSKYNAAELKEIFKKFHPQEPNVPATKKELLDAIGARVIFLQDEKRRQELEQIEQNRLNAAGAGDAK